MILTKDKSVVNVLGLGIIGLPTAVHISKVFTVMGYDIRKEAVDRATSHGIKATTSWSDVSDADIHVITVSTGMTKDEKPDVSQIYDVCSKISMCNPAPLVCIESTVPLGTCRHLLKTFNFDYLVCCPHRYWAEDTVQYGIVQPRILGAINEESLKLAQKFYNFINIPIHVVTSIEMAELSKIVENAYRFVQISFAEELSLICEKLSMSFEEVQKACNTKWNIEILEARNGIGGDCLPKDVRYVWNIMKSPLLEGAIKADAEYKAAKRGEHDNPSVNSSI